MIALTAGCVRGTRSTSVRHEKQPPTPICEEVEPAPADGRTLSADEVAALKGRLFRLAPPQYVSGPSPQYAEEAIEHGIEGTMLVACRVLTNGCAVGCRVLQGLPYMDEAVLSALQRRHYRPVMLDFKPVNAEWTFKITLVLPH